MGRVYQRTGCIGWYIDYVDALDESPAHYRRIWIAFLTTGLRRTELVELKGKDIDLARGLLRVRMETCKVKREDYQPPEAPGHRSGASSSRDYPTDPLTAVDFARERT